MTMLRKTPNVTNVNLRYEMLYVSKWRTFGNDKRNKIEDVSEFTERMPILCTLQIAVDF
jgi:hypothetical protein